MRIPMFVCSATLLAALVGAEVLAQEGSPESAYQRGASAYFAGRADQAEEHLSAAIEYAPDDPRAYYLRGLNRLATGNTRDAQVDLAEGARLEARFDGASPLVDHSLASVQGSARLTLERIRRAARKSAKVAERRTMAMARKEAREQQEQRVLRTDYQLPIEALASRLTVAQARGVAIKDRSAASSMLASDNQTPGRTASADSTATDDANPFADDTYDEAATFAADSKPSTSGTNDVEIPEAARGSVKASSLFSIFGSVGRRATENLGSTAKGVVPPIPGAGGSPFGGGPMPQGGGFGQPGFEQGGFEQGAFEQPAVGEDSPLMEQSENPFDFAE